MKVEIIGVDYSVNSSGLNSKLLDGIMLMPSWDEIDMCVWQTQLQEILSQGNAKYLSTLDLETRLISKDIWKPIFLSPPRSALAWVSKPPSSAAERLGFASIESISVDTDQAELESFVRRSSNGVWVKGQHYEAIRAHSFRQVQAAADYVDRLWGGPVHIEQHINGQELGIAFVALHGNLVDCVSMEKTVLTATGKTWAGRVIDVHSTFRELLSEWISHVGWHGAGELELLKTWDGRQFLMEINPRFPAWIHGATVSGVNLPAALIEGTAIRDETIGIGFTRTIEEIPIRNELWAPRFEWPGATVIDPAAKHPSGMPAAARKITENLPSAGEEALMHNSADLVSNHDIEHIGSTPSMVLKLDGFKDSVEKVYGSMTIQGFELAYSIKTNPHPELLTAAIQRGMQIEAISQDEMRFAIEIGARPESIILNGPAKWWRMSQETTIRGFFVDSAREFQSIDRALHGGAAINAEFIGVRLSRSATASRFGFGIDSQESLLDAKVGLKGLARLAAGVWGVHFHLTESSFGPDEWVASATAILQASNFFIEDLGYPSIVDWGGGWHINDIPLLADSVQRVLERSPSWVLEAPSHIFELGKSVLESSAELVTSVVLGADASGDVVVDASIADAPETQFWPHPVQLSRGGRRTNLPRGNGRLLGRTCMEQDILATNIATDGLQEGDLLIIARVGGYDSSMKYPFGRGSSRGTMC